MSTIAHQSEAFFTFRNTEPSTFPVSFVRPSLTERGYASFHALRTAASGSRLFIAGLNRVRQMPGSAKGVMLVIIEDETANVNLIVWPSVFEQNSRPLLAVSILGVRRRVQSASNVIHLVVEEVRDLTNDLKSLSGSEAEFPASSLARR